MTLNHIIFTADAAEAVRQILKVENYSKIAVLVDENTLKYCYPMLRDGLPEHSMIQICSGEIHKTLETCSDVWQQLTALQFDRKSLMINLGGGVIGDLGGFCAATFKRGIDFINVPTTLLSQVDASVGGKLGVDFNGFKNHIGLFQEPKNILVDLRFLKTLPSEELTSGFAEVIKHHLIADSTGWDALQKSDFTTLDWQQLVPHSVKIKYDIVQQDPRESGIRKALNFGHTIGHGVESYLLNEGRPILHGEAVAIGMVCESYISHRRGLISSIELNEISGYILKIFTKVHLSEADRDAIGDYLLQDKKNKGNSILATLLKGIGNVVWDQAIDQSESLEALIYYDKL